MKPRPELELSERRLAARQKLREADAEMGGGLGQLSRVLTKPPILALTLGLLAASSRARAGVMRGLALWLAARAGRKIL